ncbi:WD40 repeat-like protein [Cristinia sonorae]|uniref:WD40 repeat-like protein n=1 Tax=Cristinia sonorae TaxID=1940300 RepID=A0A8K0XP78_9AGAR|nr:WD40 repeat-like protein [Cristinia sonorae]
MAAHTAPLDLSYSDDDRGEGSSSGTPSHHFSRLLGSVLGSPFLTTSDLPTEDRSTQQLDGDDLETIDGALSAVPRGFTVTRPSSPSPSFRTETYSIVNWENNDVFGDGRPSMSDAAPSCSIRFRPLSSRGLYAASAYLPSSASTPYNTVRFGSPSPIKPSRSMGLLPKIWDALRESSPTKRGKRRFDNISATLWNELDIDGIIDYANLPPLDGEEGELIDDEACFIDVRAVTGVDIIALVPEEVALHVLSCLDLSSTVACLSVSKKWRRLALDNSLWRDLFRARNIDGWAIDPRRIIAQTPASLLAMSHSGQWNRGLPAQLELDWRDLYMSRAILEKRWAGTAIVGSSEDKENAAVFEPTSRKMYGHTDSVYCLEFDSSKIITGSRDRTIKVWSLKTGKCLATFSGHNGSVLCLKFDKDWELDPANALSEEEFGGEGHNLWRKGFMVSGSSDSSVCVWDMYACPVENEDGTVDLAVTAVVRRILRGHMLGVLDIRIDDRWIISCSKDALIRVWDRKTLELNCTFSGHEGPVNAVGLQGNRVASASGDGKMMLWDISTGERVRIFEGHDRGLACIEFKDDTIVSGSNDFKIKVWNANTGECVRTLAGHDNLVRALSFDPRSGRLVSGSYDRTVKVWDLKTGRMVREFKGCHNSHIFDVNFDATRIVSTSHDQKICILDFADGLNASLFA